MTASLYNFWREKQFENNFKFIKLQNETDEADTKTIAPNEQNQ